MREVEVVRDPLWDNIRIDAGTMRLVDDPAVQRLRYVRQLGHAFLVYPGATHSRFEHALGAFHLARRALAALQERGELDGVPPADVQALPWAALLHDIGHYPFSHALEEAGFPSHEGVGTAKLDRGSLGGTLRDLGGAALPGRIAALMTGRSTSPLAGLVSGSLDLDKIEYLSRDAHMCGVPYGNVDVNRLLASLTLVETAPGRIEVGVLEKGLSALESLLFAKYQMYRNVYWHHAVRAATCMFKRAVRAAVAHQRLEPGELVDATDDQLLERLVARGPAPLVERLRARRLYKRALELPASDVPAGAQPWLWEDAALLEAVEDRLAAELGAAPGAVLLDYPARPSMLAVDLPLRTRDGRVERLTGEGRAGALGLPRVAEALYQSARRLRVFTGEPLGVRSEAVLRLVTRPAAEVRAALAAGGPLLAG